MNESVANRLPPIIVDYISKLSNKEQSKFTRESYCLVLENIVSACNTAIDGYKKETKVRVAKKR